MFNLTESQELTALQHITSQFDDVFFIEARETPLKIKTIDGQEYLLAIHLYAIVVKNLSDNEYQLFIGIQEPEPEPYIQSMGGRREPIIVKKGQYNLALKHKSQYQESLKKRAEKYDQLLQTRFKNWVKDRAKDLRDTKQNDIIIGLVIAVISFLLGKAC